MFGKIQVQKFSFLGIFFFLSISTILLSNGTQKDKPIDGLIFAPEEPGVCIYLNLGIGLQAILGNQAACNATGDFLLFQTAFEKTSSPSSSPTNFEQVKRWLGIASRLFVEEGVQPEGLFFFSNKEFSNYRFVLTGNFLGSNWKPAYKEDMIEERRDGFIVVGEKLTASRTKPIVRFGNGYIVICPLEFEPEVDLILRENRIKLSEKWGSFKRMLLAKPLLATECNVSSFFSSGNDLIGFKPSEIPFPLNEVGLLRLIVSQSIVKAQIFSEDVKARTALSQVLQKLVDSVKIAIKPWFCKEKTVFGALTNESLSTLEEFVDSLTCCTQTNSIFIEGRGLKGETNLLGIAAVGFLGGVINSSFSKSNLISNLSPF